MQVIKILKRTILIINILKGETKMLNIKEFGIYTNENIAHVIIEISQDDKVFGVCVKNSYLMEMTNAEVNKYLSLNCDEMSISWFYYHKINHNKFNNWGYLGQITEIELRKRLINRKKDLLIYKNQ